jgi:hypothetical protein
MTLAIFEVTASSAITGFLNKIVLIVHKFGPTKKFDDRYGKK